ncbi:hypothetical protein [Bradyrhizobium genosp. A]|uniref:hypothetical protein n=1 Tax=Bradyrhizobium genosp. A TaxID=83626 RepID=UPI003CEC9062
MHDFVAFADRVSALDDDLARYIFGLLEATSASFDWAFFPIAPPPKSKSVQSDAVSAFAAGLRPSMEPARGKAAG